MAALRAAAANPVHAYLFRGPPGNGGLAAAYGFAAALLCPEGVAGSARPAGRPWPAPNPICTSCAAAALGLHRDLRQVVTLAQRRPLHAARQVIVVLDVHLVLDRAPVLLKTLEEPPGTRSSCCSPTTSPRTW